ncbi:MAG: tRNA uridine-5-carboxymethylaminomethyl(34) synthesis GTPase MnmE, partial [Bacteroidales bacterium]
MSNNHVSETICALATVQGVSAVSIIRLSGPKAIEITDKVFRGTKATPLSQTPSHRLRLGTLYDGERVIDEVLVSIFRAPRSYTGEESVEISCHGSVYIQQEILTLLINNGARLAKPGEFSQRAFLNAKMDLAQAEAVADLIASETEAAHRIALQQMRGGFSKELSQMRSSLLDLVSLMELELDFSEEDVEFADRKQLNDLLDSIISHTSTLIDSFKLGNVIKNGVPVAIVGATNTGKSTLLNALLGEERAIVSDIHGTTRDFIEDTVNLNGVTFRFVDTAGIRETKEVIEMIGIERTFEKIKSASVVILVLDADRSEDFAEAIAQLSTRITADQKIIILLNKCDLVQIDSQLQQYISTITSAASNNGIKLESVIKTAAKSGLGLDTLRQTLVSSQANLKADNSTTLVTNIRHYQSLKDTREAL